MNMQDSATNVQKIYKYIYTVYILIYSAELKEQIN